ncbi:unnamed protein product [Knipowitschia caucasica]
MCVGPQHPLPPGSPIVYTREELLAVRSSVVMPRDRHEIPAELLQKSTRGCRAGRKRREKRRGRYRPTLPSVTTGNTRSLCNKADELSALTRFQREYRDSSLQIYTETWLTESMPDSVIELDNFTLFRADRSKLHTGKSRGGGLALFVNNYWCKAEHCIIKTVVCCRDIELLAIGMRPFYLPREFSHVIVVVAYIPPSAKAEDACDLLHSTVSNLQTLHPQALFLITGDFNHANPQTVLPTFTQYINFPTRDNRTLDLFFANATGAYNPTALPPLGCSDHNEEDDIVWDRVLHSDRRHVLLSMVETARTKHTITDTRECKCIIQSGGMETSNQQLPRCACSLAFR